MNDIDAIRHLDRVHGLVARAKRTETINCSVRNVIEGKEWPTSFVLTLRGDPNQPPDQISIWTALCECEHSENPQTGTLHSDVVRRWDVAHQGLLSDVACEIASWMLARGVMLGPEHLDACEPRGVGFDVRGDGRIAVVSRELIAERPPEEDDGWLRYKRRTRPEAVQCVARAPSAGLEDQAGAANPR